MTRLHLIARLMVALLAWLSCVGVAGAHTLSVSHVDIVMAQGSGEGTVELDLALRDIALTLPLDANHDEVVTWGELVALRAPLEQLILGNFKLSTITGPCTLAPQRLATRHYDDGIYAAIAFGLHCSSQGALRIDYRLFFDRDPQHRAIISVKRGADFVTTIARAEAPRFEIPTTGTNTFLDFLREGIHHILIGYDHLAFLLSLLLPAALIRKRHAWLPSPGLGLSFKHVLGIVTAFTVAHSITLSLAALGWITPASRWIEVAIAASVLVAALNNVWPLVVQRVWVVAFSFGLIHGFGFAGALSELGLPDGLRLAALVGFNLGVEIGQLSVVCLVLPVLYAMRNKPWYPTFVMPLASIVIAALAAWWIYLRLSL